MSGYKKISWIHDIAIIILMFLKTIASCNGMHDPGVREEEMMSTKQSDMRYKGASNDFIYWLDFIPLLLF